MILRDARSPFADVAEKPVDAGGEARHGSEWSGVLCPLQKMAAKRVAILKGPYAAASAAAAPYAI